jgi:hypothetical protein
MFYDFFFSTMDRICQCLLFIIIFIPLMESCGFILIESLGKFDIPATIQSCLYDEFIAPCLSNSLVHGNNGPEGAPSYCLHGKIGSLISCKMHCSHPSYFKLLYVCYHHGHVLHTTSSFIYHYITSSQPVTHLSTAVAITCSIHSMR